MGWRNWYRGWKRQEEANAVERALGGEYASDAPRYFVREGPARAFNWEGSIFEVVDRHSGERVEFNAYTDKGVALRQAQIYNAEGYSKL